jgi:hypothetical protein
LINLKDKEKKKIREIEKIIFSISSGRRPEGEKIDSFRNLEIINRIKRRNKIFLFELRIDFINNCG